MKVFLMLTCFILSFSLYGDDLKPCQVIGFAQVARYAIPSDGSIGRPGITIQERKKVIKLLKKCLKRSSVCIVEADLRSKNWLSDKLVEPVDRNFDPVERHLVFGLLQYVDKKSGSLICIVAGNSFARAVPWVGESWIIDKKNIAEYELYGDRFNTVMTPNSLYKALLTSHKDAVASAEWDDVNMKKKIETARQMLEEGSDPSFVSKLTGISLENLKLLQKN